MAKVLALDNATGQVKEIDVATGTTTLSLPAYTQAPLLLKVPLVSNSYALAYKQAGSSLQVGVIT